MVKFSIFGVLILMVSLSGCLKTSTTSKLEKIPFNALYPVFNLTNNSISKGGIKIEVEFLNKARVVYANSYKKMSSMINVAGATPMVRSVKPSIQLQPGGNKVILQVSITNNSPHVLRSQSAILAVDYDDGLDMHRKNYQTSLGRIQLLPGKSKVYKVKSLSLRDIARSNRNAKIKVAIYELKIGNKLENFLWSINYKTIRREYMAYPAKSESKHYYNEEARALLSKRVIYSDEY